MLSATIRLPHWVHGAYRQHQTIELSSLHQTKEKKNKVPALKLGTWNIRTMTPGLSDNLQQVSDVQKTAAINNELCRLQVDIIALQETRLHESGIIR